MEYRKDKRTKNLTLRDIHVGDWIQVWSEGAERYSPPLKITQICDDGTIYLVTDDEERCTPWEENIKDIDALPITPDLLKGFGFEVGGIIFDGFCSEYQEVYLNCRYIGKFLYLEGKLINFETVGILYYMHELISYLRNKDIDIKLGWKGIEK